MVRSVIPVLIQDGKMTHAYLGISSVSLDLDINEALKLPTTTPGALVLSVAVNSPAAQAGIRAGQQAVDTSTLPTGGDVITAINNQPIRSSDELIAYLFTKTTAGQTVTLTLLQDGKPQSIQAKLVARPTLSQR